MAVPGMPPFSIRWTEPNGRLGKVEHTVDVKVHVPTDAKPVLTGHVTATSADFIGRIPSGSLISTSRVVNDDADLALASNLWKTVRDSHVNQWVPAAAAPGGKLDRDDMELVVQRGKDKFEVYRTDIGKGAQPIQDVLAAAGHVVGELRLHRG